MAKVGCIISHFIGELCQWYKKTLRNTKESFFSILREAVETELLLCDPLICFFHQQRFLVS